MRNKQMADQRIIDRLETEMMWLRQWYDDAQRAFADTRMSDGARMSAYIESLHRIAVSEAGIIGFLLSPGAPDADSAIASKLATLVKRTFQVQGTVVMPAIEK
jgi:hypothetical protein